MNASFSYTGDHLTISLSVDGEGDEAVAKLVEGLRQASVNVTYTSDRYGYSTPKPSSIQVTLQAPDAQTPTGPSPHD